MELIDKATVVEEIYRLRDFANDRWDIEEVNGVDKFLDKLIPYINSLEVKEVGDNSLEKFKSLQHINKDSNKILEDWGYAPIIDKDALVAEIEKIKRKVDDGSSYCNGWQHALRKLEIEINTIEVKGVDLNEEIEKCLKKHSMLAVGKKDFTDIAKHFFELGIQQSNHNKNEEKS